MKTITRFAAGITAGTILLSMTACGDDKKILESTKEDQTVVMTVAGHDVPLEIYRYIALNYKRTYESGQTQDIWLGESGAALIEELNTDVEESIVNLYATLVMCEEYGINADDAYITDSLDITMDAIYEEYDYDYETYAGAIAQYSMNDSVYRFIMRNELLADELLNAMIERGEILADEASLQAVFDSGEFIRVKQILIASDNGKTDEENLARANELLDMVNGGADFDTLVQDYGEDLFMFNNHDGYYFARGSFYPEFEDAAFSLDVGEVSGVIKTTAGYSILKRYEKDSAYIEENFTELGNDYIDGCYNMAVEAYAETLTVTATDNLKNYSIFNLADTEE